VVAAASAMKRSAVEKLLRANYPRISRIALGLCGRESIGRGVIKTVIARSLKVMPRWRNETDAINWFLHHTVIAARAACKSAPRPREDCLLTRIGQPSPAYDAFVRALRHLPSQQAEAFLLFRCEHLEPRQSAVAMDCSTAAAANHLIAANKALSGVTVDQFDAQSDTLDRVYASLTPTEDLIVGKVAAVGRRVSRRRLRRLLFTLIILAMAGAAGWIIWRFVHAIEI
jgi:DNA-directed RNA polymerase specialized sigma24 family protein